MDEGAMEDINKAIELDPNQTGISSPFMDLMPLLGLPHCFHQSYLAKIRSFWLSDRFLSRDTRFCLQTLPID